MWRWGLYSLLYAKYMARIKIDGVVLPQPTPDMGGALHLEEWLKSYETKLLLFMEFGLPFILPLLSIILPG